MNANIFIFDINKCVGCQACTLACMVENGLQEPEQWRNIHTQNREHTPGIPLFHWSLACNHCDDAPCMKNCPANAFSRDKNSGAVLHSPQKCIGCKYCTWACPFDAPKYNSAKGIIEKCTFCNHRISDQQMPACAQQCPTGALGFANQSFSRNESDLSSPIPSAIGSKLKTVPLRNIKGPEQDAQFFSRYSHPAIKQSHLKINFAREWPLFVFTFLVSLVVSLASSSKVYTLGATVSWGMLGLMTLASLVSLMHLGRKAQSWRAVLNVRHSWVSREIVLFGILFIMLLVDSFFLEVPLVLFRGVGVLLLVSIDQLYHIATYKWPMKLHSAETLFMAASLFFIFEGYPLAFALLTGLRFIMYMGRGIYFHQEMKSYRLLRLLLLLGTVFSLFYFPTSLMLLPLFLAGECIDRMEFYNELKVVSPQNDINETV